jgi:hypothetical protein
MASMNDHKGEADRQERFEENRRRVRLAHPNLCLMLNRKNPTTPMILLAKPTADPGDEEDGI